MVLIAVALVLIVLVILSLTGGFGRRRNESVSFDAGRIAAEVADVAEKALGQEIVLSQERRPVLGDVLLELMGRLGVDRGVAAENLERAGLPADSLPDRTEARPPHLSVSRPAEAFGDIVERALLVGIQVARIDDDYARVGDDYLDLETLAQRAEEAEVELFGESRRERYVVYGKAALVLQDMLEDEPEGERREALRRLLRGFDEQIELLQAEMDRAMAAAPEPETLSWGDSRDRRLYYFKMGVTNSLRRGGHLGSLGHLYRRRGVNYDVEEAYHLAAQECPPLVLADEIEIDRLLRMGPAEVQGLVRGALQSK